jgi:hypothetical protein
VEPKVEGVHSRRQRKEGHIAGGTRVIRGSLIGAPDRVKNRLRRVERIFDFCRLNHPRIFSPTRLRILTKSAWAYDCMDSNDCIRVRIQCVQLTFYGSERVCVKQLCSLRETIINHHHHQTRSPDLGEQKRNARGKWRNRGGSGFTGTLI